MKALRVYHPGEIITKDLEDINMKADEFAIRIGVTPKIIADLLARKSRVTPDLAERLTKILGGNATYWLKLQEGYDSWLKND